MAFTMTPLTRISEGWEIQALSGKYFRSCGPSSKVDFPLIFLCALQYPPPSVPVASNALAREACIGVEQSLRDFLSTRPGFKSGRQAGSFSLIKKYRCTWPFSFCFWIALLAVVLCWTGTEQTVIPLTGLVQRTHALGHAINRSGGPQSFVVTTRVRRINPFP
jgi:hypothetical protein